MPHVIIESDAQWHALRAQNIGGSEIAALFGLSQWLTHFTLWHEKAGKVKREREENDRMRWGKMLEPLIAQDVGLKLGWSLRPARTYHTHPTVRGMGCTLDFDVLDHQWGPGLVETKVIFEYKDFKEDWSDDRAPPGYEMQVQQQLAITGLSWGATVPWVAQTATLAPALIRRPNAEIIQQICERTEAFWKSIDDNEPPAPSGTEAELDLMRLLWPARTPKKVLESGDMTLAEAAQLFVWAAEQKSGMEREYTLRKAQLLGAAQDAELLRLPGWDVDIKQNKRGAITIKAKENANNGVVATVPEDKTTLMSG